MNVMNKGFIPRKSPSNKSFTLIELIIVIIIVGILAAVGISQYSLTIEKSRVTEATERMSTVAKLAYQFYLENGTFVGITNDLLGIGSACDSKNYYSYVMNTMPTATDIWFYASRCTSGGKPPQGPGYQLEWRVNANGTLTRYGYANSSGGWVWTSNWGGCCR